MLVYTIWINIHKPKPLSGLCEICNIKPFRDAANLGIYDRNFENWKYACVSCHRKLDYENGARRGMIGKDNPNYRRCGEAHPMYGKHNPNPRKKVSRVYYACDSTTKIDRRGWQCWHLIEELISPYVRSVSVNRYNHIIRGR